MSDPFVQRRLREARAQGDAESWSRAAQALARAARYDEAGVALDHAARRGADPSQTAADRETLEPRDVGAFRVRHLEAGFLAGRLTRPTFHDEGRVLFTVEDADKVLRWDLARGTQRRAVEIPKGRFRQERLLALGAAPDGGLALALGWADLGWNDPSSLVLVSADGTLPKKPQAQNDRAALDLVCVGDDLLLVEEAKRIRAYRRHGETLTLAWTFTAPQVALGRVAMGVSRKKLRFQEPLAAEPYAVLPVEVSRRERWALAAARERAIYLTTDAGRTVIDLYGPAGLLARCPFTAERRNLIPSPSGRYVAIEHRSEHLVLLDLRTGDRRSFPLEVQTQRPAWSPGGRRLAVPTSQGGVYLIEAPRDGPPPPSAVQTEDWVELTRDDRFWRARVRGARIEYRYGLRGRRGRTGDVECGDPEAARRELERRLRAKRRDGYL